MIEATVPTLISIVVFMAMLMLYTFNYLYTNCKWLVHDQNNGHHLLHGDHDHVVDCAVCLSKLSAAGQTLRVLKECNHGFHAHCIDAWLKFHSTCPLCRTNIVPSAATASSSEHGEGGGLFSWSIAILTSMGKWMDNIYLDDELTMAVCVNFTSLS